MFYKNLKIEWQHILVFQYCFQVTLFQECFFQYCKSSLIFLEKQLPLTWYESCNCFFSGSILPFDNFSENMRKIYRIHCYFNIFFVIYNLWYHFNCRLDNNIFFIFVNPFSAFVTVTFFFYLCLLLMFLHMLW